MAEKWNYVFCKNMRRIMNPPWKPFLFVIVLLMMGGYFLAQKDDAPTVIGNVPIPSRDEEIKEWSNDHRPSATQIYGNHQKWAGSYVKITCKITNVLTLADGRSAANAMCGESMSIDIQESSTANIGYTDAVARAEKQQVDKMNNLMRKAADVALLVLIGDKTMVHNALGRLASSRRSRIITRNLLRTSRNGASASKGFWTRMAATRSPTLKPSSKVPSIRS